MRLRQVVDDEQRRRRRLEAAARLQLRRRPPVVREARRVGAHGEVEAVGADTVEDEERDESVMILNVTVENRAPKIEVRSQRTEAKVEYPITLYAYANDSDSEKVWPGVVDIYWPGANCEEGYYTRVCTTTSNVEGLKTFTAVGTDDDSATTSATCAISDPSRSLRSPAHRASIATVSSVSRHAKMRRRRFASIDVLASPVTFASKNLAHASATRMHASSRRGLVGTPLGTPVRFLPMRS